MSEIYSLFYGDLSMPRNSFLQVPLVQKIIPSAYFFDWASKKMQINSENLAGRLIQQRPD